MSCLVQFCPQYDALDGCHGHKVNQDCSPPLLLTTWTPSFRAPNRVPRACTPRCYPATLSSSPLPGSGISPVPIPHIPDIVVRATNVARCLAEKVKPKVAINDLRRVPMRALSRPQRGKDSWNQRPLILRSQKHRSENRIVNETGIQSSSHFSIVHNLMPFIVDSL